MKKIATTATLCVSFMFTFAQGNSTLIRRDTVLLKSSECNWLVSNNKKQTVSESILHAIEIGKLKAIDPNSGKIIPANKISTWTIPIDTVLVQNEKTGKMEEVLVQGKIIPSRISEIKMEQDWYLDATSGKIVAKVKWIEPRIEVYNAGESFIGYKTFCHIDYP